MGRLDANTTELTSLHAQRSELDDVPGCEGLAGPCDCPAVGGVDCVDKRCAWVSLEGDDPCARLEQSTYASVKELECGLGPNGVELCRWSLSFTSSEFTWQHSDVGETGSFACKDGAITASPLGGTSYTGTITADGTLPFEGEAYERK